jgi:hypothetical protein
MAPAGISAQAGGVSLKRYKNSTFALRKDDPPHNPGERTKPEALPKIWGDPTYPAVYMKRQLVVEGVKSPAPE